MTKNFNDILDGSVKFGDSQRDCFEKGFEAGQQSKQAEVDELQKRIDICKRLRDCQFDKLWNLTQAIERARIGADEDFDLFLNHMDKILKGDSHES